MENDQIQWKAIFSVGFGLGNWKEVMGNIFSLKIRIRIEIKKANYFTDYFFIALRQFLQNSNKLRFP